MKRLFIWKVLSFLFLPMKLYISSLEVMFKSSPFDDSNSVRGIVIRATPGVCPLPGVSTIINSKKEVKFLLRGICFIATNKIWVVVSNTFYFHLYLGKIPILTNIFQMG